MVAELCVVVEGIGFCWLGTEALACELMSYVVQSAGIGLPRIVLTSSSSSEFVSFKLYASYGRSNMTTRSKGVDRFQGPGRSKELKLGD